MQILDTLNPLSFLLQAVKDAVEKEVCGASAFQLVILRAIGSSCK